jgi:hypothetical protein
MFELVYCSSAVESVGEIEVKDIWDTANQFNSEHEISGCLMFHNGQFLQLLEGDETIVKQLYAKIQEDSRHFDCKLMSTGTKDVRTFSCWGMAYCNLKNSPDEKLAIRLFENNLKAYYQNLALLSSPTASTRNFWLRVLDLIQ